MENFALDLSSMIIHLEYQRKRLLENPEAKKKMCACRVNLLNNFTSVIQKLSIRLCARTIKYAEDYNFEKALAFEGLQEWYYEEMYHSLLRDESTSNKMVLLFRLLQKDVDVRFFNKINNDFGKSLKRILETNSNGDSVDELLEEVMLDIKKWSEMFILNILAIQINCQNIDNKIFSDFDVPNDEMVCASKLQPTDRCVNCANISCNACCKTHGHVLDKGEKLTLIVTREMLRASSWIESFFKTFDHYHLQIDNVTLRLDYRMFDKSDPLIFATCSQKRFNLAKSIFSKIQIKNHGGVMYGSYLPVVKEYFTQCERNK